MVKNYEVVTLCGSTRFKDDFMEASEFLTLQGYIVISVGMFSFDSQNRITPDIKAMLDDMHKRRIDMADSIFVINRDDYIGESTASEIAYAAKTGKEIRYMFTRSE